MQYPGRSRLLKRSILSPRFSRVYQLVRAPLPHISAFTSHLAESYSFVRRVMRFERHSDGQEEWYRDIVSCIYVFRKGNVSHIVHSFRPNNPSVCIKPQLSQLNPNFTPNMSQLNAKLNPQVNSEENCGRGQLCNLPLSAVAWFFWNRHVSTYADAVFRIEDQLPQLMDTIRRQVDLERSIASDWTSWILSPRAVSTPAHFHMRHLRFNQSDLVVALGRNFMLVLEAQARSYGYT